MASLLAIELAHQAMPLLLAKQPAQAREAAGKEAFDGVVEQLAVDPQATFFDVRRRRIAKRVAQVPGEAELLLAQALIHDGVLVALPLADLLHFQQQFAQRRIVEVPLEQGRAHAEATIGGSEQGPDAGLHGGTMGVDLQVRRLS